MKPNLGMAFNEPCLSVSQHSLSLIVISKYVNFIFNFKDDLE